MNGIIPLPSQKRMKQFPSISDLVLLTPEKRWGLLPTEKKIMIFRCFSWVIEGIKIYCSPDIPWVHSLMTVDIPIWPSRIDRSDIKIGMMILLWYERWIKIWHSLYKKKPRNRLST